MGNYIKSECYRLICSKWIYVMGGVLAALAFLYNLVSYLFYIHTPDFRYGTTSFAFSNLVAYPMLYCYAAFLIADLLWEADTRNGTHGNSISWGIPRTGIVLGKCVVGILASLILLAVTITVFAVSSLLLLEHGGPTRLQDLLMEIPAVSLIAISSFLLSVLVLELFDRMIVSLLTWLSVMVVIPRILFFLGMKIHALMPVALWMPENFFSVEMSVNMSRCITLWSSPEGMAKCLISGAVGILLFGAAGICLAEKKEL